jgi:hypothetical protein
LQSAQIADSARLTAGSFVGPRVVRSASYVLAQLHPSLLGAAPFRWGWRVSVPADLPDAVAGGPEGVVVIAELACPLLVEVAGRGMARGPRGGF